MLPSYARRGLAAAGVFLIAVGAVLAQNAAVARRDRFPAGDDALYLPRPSALRALALGRTELVADLVFLRATVYFGTQVELKGQFRWLDHYLDTITALDPAWKTPYRWAGVATMYNGRPITNDMVEASSHFLERGARQFPNDWELPFMLACNYLFELQTHDPQQKAAWQRIGGDWLRHATLVGGGPSWLPLLAATVMQKEGQKEAALRHLETVYAATDDERTREQIRYRLIGLHAQVDFAKEAKERAAFEEAWKRTLPYASPDLFVLVGAAAPPRMDLSALLPGATPEAPAEGASQP